MWYKLKRILIHPGWVEKQVRPSGWQPWANTVAYRPLTEDVNDYSNSHNWTNHGVTFSSWQAIQDVGYFNGSSYISVPNSTDFFWSKVFTISFWKKSTGIWSIAWDIVDKWNDNQANCVCTRLWYRSDIRGLYTFITRDNSASYTWIDILNSWLLDGNWHNVVSTFDNGVSTVYIDNTQVWYVDNSSHTFDFASNTSPLFIGVDITSWGGVNEYYYIWYLSNVIIENKAWTSTEKWDYFNLTKWNYWL